MKKIIFTILSLMFALSTVYSQKGIDYNFSYGAGRSLEMFVDSAAKNVYYGLQFPNQPNTSFNFLPDVNHINLRFNFKKTTDIAAYRYTILVNYPFAKDKWASGFTDLCFVAKVLFESPPV